MSQYPAPYWPSPGQAMYPGYNPYAALMTPARRAGIMMFVLGGLSLLCGSCAGAFSLTDFSRLPADQQEKLQAAQAQLAVTYPGVTLQQAVGNLAVVGVGIGLAMLILGFFVRRGGRKSLIVGLCLVIPLGLVFGAVIIKRIIDGDVQAAIVAAMVMVPIAMLLRWLVQAMGNTRHLQAAQSQYQTQYAQYQQNAQMYAQNPPPPYPGYGGGYGGGYGAGEPGFVPGQGAPGVAPQQPPPQPPLPPVKPET